MSAPRIELIGQGAEDYIPEAIALYRSGRRGWRAVDDKAVIRLWDEKIRILMIFTRFFFMHFNKTFVRVDTGFQELFGVNPGAFRSTAEVDTSSYPRIPYSSCPLTPEEEGYVMPWVVACAPAGEMINVKTASFALWRLGAGETGPYKVYPYTAPPTIPVGTTQFTRYAAIVLQPEIGYNYAAIVYQMNPSDNSQANNRICHARFEMYDGTAVIGEVEIDGYPVVLGRDRLTPGFVLRQFYGAENTSRVFYYQHDPAGGLLSEVIATPAGLETADALLPALPARSHVDRRYIDSMYDIFTSENAAHFYVVRFDSDLDVHYQGTGYSANIGFYSGTALIVEKRLKTDWSLVQTYNLTPTAVDTTLMGAPIKAQVRNCDGGTAFTMPAAPRLTRFTPVGTDISIIDSSGRIAGQSPLSCGTVLMDGDTEYPILPVLMVTQDYLFGTEAQRTAFLSSGDTTGITMGTFTQAALLWLGAPIGAPGWRWSGVDACGLDFATSDIGTYQAWLREPLSDGSTMLGQIVKAQPDVVYLAALQTNPDNIDGVRYATDPLYILCTTTGAEEGDKLTVVLGYDLGGATGAEETFTYTASAGDTEAIIIAALISTINGSTIYSCSPAATPAGYVGTCLKVNALNDRYLTGVAHVSRPTACQGLINRIAKITIQNSLPVVESDLEIHSDVSPFWYEFMT